jgi:hypothetical protein
MHMLGRTRFVPAPEASAIPAPVEQSALKLAGDFATHAAA